MAVYLYDRVALLAKLKQIAPALGDTPLMPQMQQAWFTDIGLLATNGQIALVTGFPDPPPNMGVNGVSLLKLLATARTDQVQFDVLDNGALSINAQEFSAVLHTSDGEPPFRWPSSEAELPAVWIDENLSEALKRTEQVVNPTSPNVQARGVTLVRDDAGLTLYATDSKSLLRQAFEGEEVEGAPLQAVMTMACVKEMIRLAPGWLQIDEKEGYALFSNDANDISLWGRLIQPGDWIDFEHSRKTRLPKEHYPIPDGFATVIERAGILTPKTEDKRKPCSLQLDGDNMHIISIGPAGTVTSTLPFPHSKMTVSFDQLTMGRFLGKKYDGMLEELGASKDACHMVNSDGSISYLMASTPPTRI